MAEQPLFYEIAPEKRNPARRWSGALAAFEDDVLNNKLAGRLEAYKEVLSDSQVLSTFQQRRLAVVSKEWIVEPGGPGRAAKAAADFLREQLSAIPWDGITDAMLYGRFYGYSIAECLWATDGRYIIFNPTETADGNKGIAVRKRERFRYANLELGGGLVLLTDQSSLAGEQMPPCKFWTFRAGDDNTDNPYGLGLANALYWPAKFKRDGIGYWLIFLDRLGTPTIKASLPAGIFTGQDDSSRRQREGVKEALAAIQSDSGILLPDTAAIELLEASKSGVGSYDQLCDRMDAAISKIVLSQTMTSDDGSSRSQAEVHQAVADAVIKADADLICQTFTDGPAKWLTGWNFPEGTPVPKVWRQVEAGEDLDALATRDAKIIDMGYRPGLKYIKETYGEHWEETPPPPSPVTATLEERTGGGLPPLPPVEFNELPPEIVAAIYQRRQDQQDIKDLATDIANHYEGILGTRVAELQAMLDETGDLATFRERLNDLINSEQPPPPAITQAAERAGIVGRLLGRLRGQV